MTETAPLKPAEFLNLNHADRGLRKLLIGAGWDFNPYDGEPLDVDLCCFALNRDGQTRVDDDFVFYNQPSGVELAIRHLGDNRTGAGDGDDEAILLELDNLSFDIWSIVIVVAIYQGDDRDQNFGQLREATLRLENADSGQELFRMNFADNDMLKKATAIKVAELRREGVEWSLHAINEAVPGGLAAIAKSYGLLISSTT